MNELISFLIINANILFQAGYDFIVWYGYNKDNDSPAVWKKVYRVLKAIIDYPLSWYSMIQLNVIPDYITAFYIFKQFGGVDGIYILLWKLFNSKRNYTQDGIYWMAFTPLGMFRSRIIYNPIINADEIQLYTQIFGKWYFKKGIMNLDDYLEQLGYGIILSIGIMIFKPVTYLINLF